MYAVISTGGKQYKVTEGQTLRLERVPGEVGTTVSFDRVLMTSDGEALQVGRPTLPGVTVTGRIVEQGKAKKVIVFKYKRRKGYRRKQGHRQLFTALRIDAIKDVDTALKE
jgi:large subunit ribosomal protein L21